MPVDFSKPIRTKDGHRVRILCTDLDCNDGYCVVGAVLGSIFQYVSLERWTLAGKCLSHLQGERDLVNLPTKYYVGVYWTSSGITLGSPVQADSPPPCSNKGVDFIKYIEVEVP